MSITLDTKHTGKNVLHLQPACQRQRRVSKHPVHQRSQLQQKRNCKKPATCRYQCNAGVGKLIAIEGRTSPDELAVGQTDKNKSTLY